jgi:hypothetical protein
MTNPETHHVRTGAAKTTTSETATPGPAPSVAQVLATQKAGQTIDKAGNVVKAEQLPTPILTDAQRTENIRKNMAAIGTQFLSRYDFEAVKGVFEMDGDDYRPGLSVCPIRECRIGFRRFNGEGNPMDLMLLRLDEGDLYTRDDLDGGFEEEDGKFGRRYRWQEFAQLPLIEASGGGELCAFEANNLTSYWAIRNLLGRCYAHPMFKRGLSPVVLPESTTYKHKDYGMRFKPVFKICGWANPDGTPADTGKAQPSKQITTGADFNDTVPF